MSKNRLVFLRNEKVSTNNKGFISEEFSDEKKQILKMCHSI